MCFQACNATTGAMRCAFLRVLVCALVACAGDQTPIAEDDYCTAIAEAQCDGAFRCCPTVDQRFVTRAECVSAYQSGCENTVLYARVGRVSGVPLDGVTYDAAEGARVVSEFRDAAASCETPPDTFVSPGFGGPSPTNPIPRPYRGALDRDAVCIDDKECTSELVCRPAADNDQARHCLPVGATGDGCLLREHCADGSYCSPSGICAALGNDGDTCFAGARGCAAGLICAGLESPDDAHCTPLSVAGELCFAECSGDSLCETSCAPGTFCSRPRGEAPVCAPRGNIGDPCTTSDPQECQSGFCDRASDTCAACSEHAQCGSAFRVCRSGVCVFELGAPELRSHCPVNVAPLP